MKSFKYTLFIFSVLLTFLACRKESSITDINTSIPEPEIFIESEIFGFVTTTDGSPLENAQVFWGAADGLTDQNGYFKLKSSVAEKIAVLHIKKENFFDAYQSLSPIKEKLLRTNVQLIERQLSGSLAASSGGIINISGGGKVEFTANSFIDDSGTPYEGTVNVYSSYLDPTIPDLIAQMPGNLMAYNSENEQRLLKSFGMVNIEIESNTGEPLQLSQSATLTVPIPPSISDQSPSTIPLWHFDTENGVWLEEGEASLQDNVYIGEVSHFTWWNCDIPQDFIYLEGSINIDQGQLPFLELRFTLISDGSTGVTSVSPTGAFAGFIPKNEVILFEVIDPCGAIVYSEELGSFEVDTQLPTIDISSNIVELITVSGNALNCDFEPVTNGYVIVQIPFTNSFGLIYIEDGNFEGSIIDCGGAQISATVFDYGFQTQSSTATMSSNTNHADFGDLFACEQPSENSFSIDLGGDIESYAPCTVEISHTTVCEYFDVDFQMVQPNGTLGYEFSISECFTDGLEHGRSETGTPDFVYYFEDIQSDNVHRITDFENAGQISRFLINNVTVRKVYSDNTEEVFSSCTLDIKALIL